MRAIQLVRHGRPGTLELREVPAPQPGADEVVVRVEACGLNHLDLWLEEAGLPLNIGLPRTPGCEPAGVIATVGSGVTAWRAGDRVAVQSNLTCGTCEYCQAGEESMCLAAELLGVQRDGGLAEFVAVPQRALNRLPDGVAFTTSAALTLAGSTAMHMLTQRATVKTGDWVLAMAGASGVGSAAIQIARGLGARVISTGSTAERRSLAVGLGAEAVVDTADPRWPAEVRRLTGKRGVDLVIEHIGGDVLPRCFECLARGGTVVTCGATAGREVTLNLWPLFVKQQRLVGSYSRNRADLEATLEWAAAGRLRPVIHSQRSLDHAAVSFQELRDRRVLGKALILPHAR